MSVSIEDKQPPAINRGFPKNGNPTGAEGPRSHIVGSRFGELCPFGEGEGVDLLDLQVE